METVKVVVELLVMTLVGVSAVIVSLSVWSTVREERARPLILESLAKRRLEEERRDKHTLEGAFDELHEPLKLKPCWPRKERDQFAGDVADEACRTLAREKERPVMRRVVLNINHPGVKKYWQKVFPILLAHEWEFCLIDADTFEPVTDNSQPHRALDWFVVEREADDKREAAFFKWELLSGVPRSSEHAQKQTIHFAAKIKFPDGKWRTERFSRQLTAMNALALTEARLEE